MPSSNYVKGRRFEYSTMSFLRKNGYYCIRSYGSKGLFDVIAVPSKINTLTDYPAGTLLIQCKTNGYVPPAERERLKKSHWEGTAIIVYRDKKTKRKVWRLA